MPYPATNATTDHSTISPVLFAVVALLSSISGYINAIMLSYAGLPASHMSGPATEIGIQLNHAATNRVLLIAGIMIAFIAGAFTSGLMIRSTVLKPGRCYGRALLLEGGLLLISEWCALNLHPHLSIILAATACGLQNALAASYRGLTLRTTHVTGVVTDIGILLAHRIQKIAVKWWKLPLLFTILIGFISGGMAGVFCYMHWGPRAIGLGAFACIFLALAYRSR